MWKNLGVFLLDSENPLKGICLQKTLFVERNFLYETWAEKFSSFSENRKSKIFSLQITTTITHKNDLTPKQYSFFSNPIKPLNI
jgi:hypothetical protein